MNVSDFDYLLPPELIAHEPSSKRSHSRLLDGRLVTTTTTRDRRFDELPYLLNPHDLLIFNDTKVVKARLRGHKPSGGQVELLIERVLADNEVIAHLKVSRKPPIGGILHLAGGYHQGGIDAQILGRWPDKTGSLFRLRLHGAAHETPYDWMARYGEWPLPPYIDPSATTPWLVAGRYQTVFARHEGAVAAPTAALHFDELLLQTLAQQGVESAYITLHVGAGTFAPMKTERIEDHIMHHERYHIPPETQTAIAACHDRGGRVVAVGTTCVRALESWVQTNQTQGDTSIFITPGFTFKMVDALITNFHLPKSTLLMLVSAFAGASNIKTLYAHAIAQRYRFFSWGDAMFLERC